MTDAIRTYPGALNGDIGTWEKENANFLKVFTGEVMTAFDTAVKFKDKHLVRTIEHGKSASFPATWKATARYHKPGTPVLGSNNILHGERVITIDDLLLADVFIPKIDEAKQHYDVRSIYSKQLGNALAKTFDLNVARVIVKAARSTATITGANGGSVLKNTNAAVDSDILAGLIFSASQIMDEKDVPEGNTRYCALKPAQYNLLAQNTKLLNKDWGGSGVYSDGTILRVGGIEIVKTNNLPQQTFTAVDGERNDYAVDCKDTVGTVWNEDAVGTVKLMDLATEMSGPDFAIMYQGTLMVAKYAIGHGILRPECAVELSKAV